MTPRHVDLGRMGYTQAYRAQCDHLEEVLAARAAGTPEVGRILTVEHDPVITVSGRAGAAQHLLATSEMLAARGVSLASTDRGGDITYHGPGQLVVYPILDLNLLNLGLHDYMRLLEGAIVDVCLSLGVAARRDPTATGVWIGEPGSKICAMGVRVRRWVSMHGLALNVRPDLSHFDLIVPCGLAGRSVTSLERELGPACPSMDRVKYVVVAGLSDRIGAAHARALAQRRDVARESA
jgi:lipoyl(octanoyl) transferase